MGEIPRPHLKELIPFAIFNERPRLILPDLAEAFYDFGNSPFPMKITSATYVKGVTELEDTPSTTFPEFAFIGRSNVGKSSLINMLTEKKGLASVSQKPGHTRLINFFLINKKWHLVDLPGYGFAKASKKDREKFQAFVSDFILNRENLRGVFQLIDSRHEPQRSDLEFTHWLIASQVPFILLFTKQDKAKVNIAKQNQATYLEAISELCHNLPQVIACSSKDGSGRKEILSLIEE